MTVRYDVVQRSGAAEIHPLETPSITWSSGARTARSLSGVVITAEEWAQIDRFTAQIQPVMVLSDGTEWPCGIFYPTGDPSDGEVVTLDALSDGTLLLDQASFMAFAANEGGSIGGLMSRITSAAQIPSWSIDPAINTARVGEPVVWGIGTSYLDMLSDLCDLASAFPPYFDAAGTLQIRPFVTPTESATSFRVADYALYGSVETNQNLLDAPNEHIVIGTSLGGLEVVGRARVSASLPWSVERRGRVIAQVHEMQGIESTAQATTMARRFASIGVNDFSELSYSCTPDPRVDAYDVVVYEGVPYRITSFTLPLSPDEMTIRAVRGDT